MKKNCLLVIVTVCQVICGAVNGQSKGSDQKPKPSIDVPAGEDQVLFQPMQHQESSTIVVEVKQGMSKEEMIKNVEDNAQHVISYYGEGKANWSTQVIEVLGTATIDSVKFKERVQARAMAVQEARMDGLAKLYEAVMDVQVYGEALVRDMAVENDLIMIKIQNVIKGAEMVGEPAFKEGQVAVRIMIGLYGEKGLANAFYSDIERYILNKNRKKSEEIKAIQPMKKNGNEDIEKEESQDSMPIIFDFKGKEINPSMFLVLVDESGNMLIDMYKVYDHKTGSMPKMLQVSSGLLKEMELEMGLGNDIGILKVMNSAPGTIKVNGSKAEMERLKMRKNTSVTGKTFLMLKDN